MGKPQFYPAVFNIDISVCMSCQICVEVCPFDAIKMDTAFELSTDNRFGGLLWRKAQLAKSNDYFHKIHPTGAAEVDERLTAAKVKAEAKAKAAADAKSLRHRLILQSSSGSHPRADQPMTEMMDQIFVILKHWLVAHSPAGVQPIVAAPLSVVAILVVFASLFAVTTILERKGLGRFQNRYGPNRVGPFGLLQPLADGLKSLTKEDIVPRAADKVVHLLAPLVLVVAAFLGYAVLPIGRNMVAVNLDAGVLFFFAVGLHRRTVDLHGRLVEPQQILAARRDARHCADDQLRGSADSFGGYSHHDGRLALNRRHRGKAGRLYRNLAALVCVHAMGIRRIRSFHDCGDR